MGPSKRKGSIRRPVLDLNAKDDSPSRPTWQNKYQQVLPHKDIQENGDVPVSQVNNPLFGLLGNYHSDSDSDETVVKSNTALDAKVEDFLKEIHSISTETANDALKVQKPQDQKQKDDEEPSYPSSVTAWQQCYDYNSGYPYYWNTETNEVTWEMPLELKAALTSVVRKQQHQMQTQSKLNQQPQSPKEKKLVKYPWQTESDSDEEKIEMITSFGPQSDDEMEESTKRKEIKKSEKNKTSKSTIGPQYLVGPSGFCIDPSKIKSDSISCAPEDSEVMTETSSLLTHCVQDTGPPGDDSFHINKGSFAKKNLVTGSVKKESETILKMENVNYTSNNLNKTQNAAALKENSFIKTTSNLDDKNQSNKRHIDEKAHETSDVDNVIADIEKELPPDHQKDLKSEKDAEVHDLTLTSLETLPQTNNQPSGIALIANYSDDSETEDNTLNEKKNGNSAPNTFGPSKSLFPIEGFQNKEEKIKPLFPCMDTELPTKVTASEFLLPKEVGEEESSENINKIIYNAENDASDPFNHKAFKRKKRLEFATTIFDAPTSKLSEMKSSSPDRSFGVYNSQYYVDPSMNEYRGFGFNSLRNETDSERKTYKNHGGIKFIKAETINLRTKLESHEKVESSTQTTGIQGKSEKDLEMEEEIEETSTLLREKMNFLTGESTQIPPIQYMAIELETLVLAWQQGALTPPYLLRWLKEKCTELIRHEKSAAPSGWTCLWDRKNKRYYYRNSVTKVTQWDYPNVEEKIKGKEDVIGGGDEMDICDTPPHMSPAGSEKQTDQQPATPPPPVISNTENVLPQSPNPQPPPPPQISFCPENETSIIKPVKRKKQKLESSQTNEGDADDLTAAATSSSLEQTSEISDVAPPLPPMPPPPPPPPDESPPPLPDSPPPLSLDPDQPLPPGVDEPEYTLYRKVSPKHAYKKTSTDSSTYSAELMMSYGYGYSSNGQPMTMQMQPIEYHTYVHDSVPNTYLVQSAPTSHVIQCSAKKPKISFNSELISFYSDLAMLDAPSNENLNSGMAESQSMSPASSSSQNLNVATNVPATMTSTTITTTDENTVTTASAVSSVLSKVSRISENTTTNGVNLKKKKKVKSTKSGLSLKKKGVSSLVAKWQQVQQEVRRDFSDDDENEAQ